MVALSRQQVGSARDVADQADHVADQSAAAGVLIERWLFFAEAKHVVTLYYGAPDA